MSSFKRWRVQLLGGLKLTSGEASITRFRSQKTGSLLAYLAFHSGRPQPREVLIDLFWSDSELKRARGFLSVALYSLRSQLDTPESGSTILYADNFNVTLNSDLFEIDVTVFQTALKRARRATSVTERRDLLEEAVNCYGGDLLVGYYDSWLVSEQVRLREQFEQAQAELELLKEEAVSSAFRGIQSHVPIQPKHSAHPTALSAFAPILPLSFTRFFGRTQELERLDEILAPSLHPNLVTLTGIGGIGKTRLARESGYRLQEAYQGRIWFVALAEIKNASRLINAIREAVRLPNEPTGEPLAQVCAYLSGAPSLLILDNMEQFVGEGRAATILQALRERVPSLCCLVTSRQLLGVVGEHAFPIGPLTGTEDEKTCIQLFEDRARSVRPAYRVTDTTYPTILRLCNLLDGIPLAIELAAARIGVLSPTQMLTQMEARFALLYSRKRDVPQRHQSLWAAIDSSYQLLPDELKRFFARLSVFQGGWTVASAQAICLDTEYAESNNTKSLQLVVEYISELQDSSLISASIGDSDITRFQMLDTLRAFAAEQLSKQGNEEDIYRRHAMFFADLAASAEPNLTAGVTSQQEWLNLLESDHNNIRLMMDKGLSPEQKLRTATALHRFWLIRGHVTEGRMHLSAAIAATSYDSSILSSERATAQNALGVLAISSGHLDEAREHFEHALEHYIATDNKDHVARVLNNIGIVAAQVGNFADARTSYEQSLSIYRAQGDSLRQSMVLSNLGGVLVYLEDYDAARKVLEECVPIQKAAKDDFALLRTLQNLAEVALRQGDIATSASTMYESLAIRRTLGDHTVIDDVLITASMILGEWNRFEEATVVWAAAQSLRALTDTVASPVNSESEKVWLEQIRQTLPEPVVAEMHLKGSAMSFEEAISYVEELLSGVQQQSLSRLSSRTLR